MFYIPVRLEAAMDCLKTIYAMPPGWHSHAREWCNIMQTYTRRIVIKETFVYSSSRDLIKNVTLQWVPELQRTEKEVHEAWLREFIANYYVK